jgi:predicted nucleic acid-binding protein
MIVVADTSPINFLVLIDAVDLLPALYGKILIPRTVFLELQDLRAPGKVRRWIMQPPEWLEVQSAARSIHPALLHLDAGEQEALQLALELGESTVLIDEIDGRVAAQSLYIQVRGTLGILEQASNFGKINFREALAKLDQHKFRISPALRKQFLRRHP